MPLKLVMSNLVRSYRINDRALIPMPRVCSTTIDEAMKGVTTEDIDGSEPVATIVRDPRDKLVSAYAEFWSNIAFEDFVWQLLNEGTEDVHLLPQSQIVPDAAWVGRYETFSRDWKACCEWLGIEAPRVSHMNASRRMPTPMYYSPKVLSAVNEYYAEDIKRYGYDFDMETGRRDTKRHSGPGNHRDRGRSNRAVVGQLQNDGPAPVVLNSHSGLASG